MEEIAEPPTRHTSIVEAERQAKRIVLAVLAMLAYFSQDVVSVPEMIHSLKHNAGVSKPVATEVSSATEPARARP